MSTTPATTSDYEHGEHGPRVRDDPPQRALVEARERAERPVDRVREARATGVVRQPRREHRRERQRDERRERDARGEREAELAEQPAEVARQERDRHEHRDQRERRRDHGEADLARAGDRRDERRLAELRAPVDVLEHDDRVVDDETDREHEPEQRQHVDRVTERVHHGQRGDDRHRDRDGRARASCARCRGRDRSRRAPTRARTPTATSTSRSAASIGIALSTLTSSLAPGGSVGCRRSTSARTPRTISSVLPFDCASTCRKIPGTAVDARVGAVVLRRELHVGDLVEPDQMPVRAARDHEVAEVLLGLEADHRAQRELARPRFEPPGRQLDVLAPQRVLDVGDGELARRERLAIDPDAHRVAARAVDASRARRPGPWTADR